MISAICWIPKGAAKAVPEQAEFTEEELAAMKAQAEADAAEGDEEHEEESESESEAEDEEDLPDAAPDSSDSEAEEEDEAAAIARAKAVAKALKGSSAAGGKSSGSAAKSKADDALAAALAELDMEHYDDDSDEELTVQRMLGSGNPGQAYYRDPSQDPFLKRQGGKEGEEGSDSEAEDFHIQDSDLLILAARNEDDVSHLEVWVYEEADERGPANLYVHHSLLLPAFPLCLAWGSADPRGGGGAGNYAAVGSFEPGIEIWDLDVVDAVEPLATLGGADYEAARALAEAEAVAAASGDGKKKKKKKGKKGGGGPQVPVRPGSHSDAVLGLAWNQEFSNVLASASADHTVKVWDVATQQCNSTLTHHSSKVQAVAWNPAEAPVLLSGGFDRRACLVDMRVEGGSQPAEWQVSADVEAVAWNPHAPTQFVVSSEDGNVVCLDARGGAGSAPLFTLAAHDKAACALGFCPAAPDLLLTASTDKKVKLWSVAGGKPSLLAAEDLKVGAVFAAGFCGDAPFTVAAGGAKGTVSVWDATSSPAVAAYVQQQQQQQQTAG